MSIAYARAVSWRQARGVLAALDPLPAISLPLHACVGSVLAAPFTAATDVPVCDSATDNGWAVSGQGPWTVITDQPARELPSLADGHAVPVDIGEALPPGSTAVLAADRGVTDRVVHRVRLQVAGPDGRPTRQPGLIGFGQGIQRQGSDILAQGRLLTGGTVVTPAAVALAAAVGRDELTVIPPPTILIVLPRFGLARHGRLRPGRNRDVTADLLATWIEAGPSRLLPSESADASPRAIAAAIDDSAADVVVVSGGVEPAVPGAVKEAARLLAARALVDGVDLAPGGATTVYELASDRYLVTLPGRPAATAAGLAVAVDPLVSALSGRATDAMEMAALLEGAPPRSARTTLTPGVIGRSELVVKVRSQPWAGPGGMQGLAAADGLVVCRPDAKPGMLVPVLPLPGGRPTGSSGDWAGLDG